MTSVQEISLQTACRFILGRQGLYPGRRYEGEAALSVAFREIESVQIDPISYLARSHDLALHSRVGGYSPDHLDRLLHEHRSLFDYGSILMIYPMEDLPAVSAIMAQRRNKTGYWDRIPAELPDYVLNEIRQRGALSSRDFPQRERIAGGFNTMKDTSLALYFLWHGGHLMSHSRDRNERHYDLYERITGLDFAANCWSLEQAEAHLGLKSLREIGLATPAEWARNITVMLHRRVSPTESKRILDALVQAGKAEQIKISGLAPTFYCLTEDLPLLETLEQNNLPESWQTDHSFEKEVAFLAPLDSVIWDRERTRVLFDFDYVWEVYKPAAVRKWGYYTLPILWGDRIVARIALRFDRKQNALHIEGYWPEADHKDKDKAYRKAFDRGLERLREFLGAISVVKAEESF